jgi:hypothetical protein
MKRMRLVEDYCKNKENKKKRLVFIILKAYSKQKQQIKKDE